LWVDARHTTPLAHNTATAEPGKGNVVLIEWTIYADISTVPESKPQQVRRCLGRDMFYLVEFGIEVIVHGANLTFFMTVEG
jgi:hypothetical protein